MVQGRLHYTCFHYLLKDQNKSFHSSYWSKGEGKERWKTLFLCTDLFFRYTLGLYFQYTTYVVSLDPETVDVSSVRLGFENLLKQLRWKPETGCRLGYRMKNFSHRLSWLRGFCGRFYSPRRVNETKSDSSVICKWFSGDTQPSEDSYRNVGGPLTLGVTKSF